MIEELSEISLDKAGQITDFEYEGLAYTLPDGYRGIHETIYQVDFVDGTTTSVVGYSVTTINSHYVVKSVYNNSMFEIKQVKGIYPKEIGIVWNPVNND